MKQIALNALDAVTQRGADYADVRVLEIRDRHVATKNGKISGVSGSVSLGVGVRVLVNGCWGFAATDDLSRDGLEAAARLAIDIAHASSAAKITDVVLAPENKYEVEWRSPLRIDPFSISIDRNIALLLEVDAVLRRQEGVTLAEASMTFDRRRQVFASSIGSLIDQARVTSGAGFSALSYKDGEIQKRSYPNSFGGQHQLKGYELAEELRLVENAPRLP